MVYGYVYLREFPNGKCYIGQTTRNPKERWKEQNADAKRENKSSIKLYNALKNHNYETKNKILTTATNQKTLDELEIFYIKGYNSIKQGYNLEKGGLGGIPSEETRKKMSESQKKKKLSKEHKNKISLSIRGSNHPLHGKRHSIESKQKISETRKKLGLSKGKNNSMYGKKFTFQHRNKIRQKGQGNGIFKTTGVSFVKSWFDEKRICRCCSCRISFNNIRKYLGVFEDPFTAQLIYDLVREEIDRELLKKELENCLKDFPFDLVDGYGLSHTEDGVVVDYLELAL